MTSRQHRFLSLSAVRHRPAPDREHRSLTALFAAIALAAGMWLTHASSAQAAVENEPGCLTSSFPANDDGVVPAPVLLGFPVHFNGQDYEWVYIDNNGLIRFPSSPSPSANPAFDPNTDFNRNVVWWQLRRNWQGLGVPLIAPFHADVDTRGSGSSVVTYGQISNYKGEIGRRAFCVNWVNVTHYDSSDSNNNRFNNFQLILVDRSSPAGVTGDFDIVFNYDKIDWESGDDSGAFNGRGGTEGPRVGYFDGTNVVELPGSSAIGALLDDCQTATGIPCPSALKHQSSNSVTPGQYIFPIRSTATAPLSVFGTITDELGDPIPNAIVQACHATGTCVGSSTNASGNYKMALDSALSPQWTIRVFPPAGTLFFPFPPSTFTISASTSPLSFTLFAPPQMPLGTGITPAATNNLLGIPMIYWQDTLELTAEGCAGTAQYEVRQNGSTIRFGAMSPSSVVGSKVLYSAQLTPFHPAHGFIEILIRTTCSSNNQTGLSIFNAYIDPSGFVLDTRGKPVVGARMTLYRAGSPNGPFEPVPDGSAIMSPSNRSNPSYTDETGHFGWDTIAGYYIVRAEKEGCTNPNDPSLSYVETDILPVPPEWTDLRLILDCPCTDEEAPVVAVTDPIAIYPYDYSMLQFSLSDCAIAVSDDCSDAIDINAAGTITSINSDEQDQFSWHDADPGSDIVLLDNSTFLVRNQRNSYGSGRVYSVSFVVEDFVGRTSEEYTCQIGIKLFDDGGCYDEPVDDGPCFTVYPDGTQAADPTCPEPGP